jgi:3-hydroxyisobutyrate dehydrogenase
MKAPSLICARFPLSPFFKDNIMNITFLGQGAMGVRMADRLAAAGHNVTRWNRTGATQSPREAVANADIVIAMLRDDAASRSVWCDPETGALSAMKSGTLAIESSTLTVEWVNALAEAAHAQGVSFLDAPVLGSRPQAAAGQLIHLIGGTDADLARAAPVLAEMGAKQLHVGMVGAGAALKLMANTLFGIQVTAMAELIGRMPALGLDPTAAIALLAETPLLSPGAKGAAGLMLTGTHDPMFPVALVAKDFGYAIGDRAAQMPVSAAALSVFDRAAAQGLAEQNLTVVAQLYDR